MSASFKDFSDLKSVRKQLQDQEKARVVAEAKRKRRTQEAEREANLFRRSVGEVAPLKTSDKHSPLQQHPQPIARQYLADEQAVLQESLSDDFDPETLMETDEDLSFARSGIGSDTLRKLRRGHWVIQSQLDLHGMRSDEAREALGEYLRNACRRGQRCVRIVHGKGLGSVNKEPVLKSKVRKWLMQKDEVIAFCQARATDGGAGALIVLLRAI
ncbi:MAG: Smr/MutS family protein [Burkholderiaceae bacterium]|nr:Smr/MutS family protein [Burkholderiaceae bacterium]